MKQTKTVIFTLLHFLLKILYFLPIKKNRVVFRSSNGDSYQCNPKYLSQYMVKNCPEDFEIIWIFNQPESYLSLEKEHIKICRANTLRAVYYLMTTGFIIDNIFPVSYIPYRKKQTVINTWHGGGSYKTGDSREPQHRKKHFKKMARVVDYRISSCARYKQRQINSGTIAADKILEFGSARNDIFFSDYSELEEKVRAYYHIPKENGILLYAPTFRVYVIKNLGIDLKRAQQACEKKYHKPFTVLYRMHKMIGKNSYPDVRNSGAIDAGAYEDAQELIAASDVIITDYSSIVWDAAVAQKPCYLFAADLAQYTERVAFDVPISEWPFPLAHNNTELEALIASFDEDKYAADCAAHLAALGSYEHGNSAEQTVNLMKRLMAENR